MRGGGGGGAVENSNMPPPLSFLLFGIFNDRTESVAALLRNFFLV